MSRWTRDAAIIALQAWMDEHGQAPVLREWLPTPADSPSVGTIYRLLGSWPDAIRAAGGEPQNEAAQWTRDTAVEALRAWTVEHGRQPVFNEWAPQPLGYPSRSTLQKLFGSWSAAIAAAGGVPRSQGRPRKPVEVGS